MSRKSKDLSKRTLDKQDEDTDVKWRKETWGHKKEWDREIGEWDGKAEAGFSKWKKEKEKKKHIQVKGAGSSTYKVIAHISLCPISSANNWIMW